MSQNEVEGSQSGYLSYELAERFSEENKKTRRYIEKLEAKIKALEADHNATIEAGGTLSISDDERNRSAYQHKISCPEKPQVIILVHGIRDRALWQSEVRASLRAAGFNVALTNYGRFDVARFLFPLPFFRTSIVKKVRNQIRTIRLQHPSADISIVAHSFGTYVVSRVMREEFDIIFNRVIFCGGVFPQSIPFEQFSNRFSPPILNEVGAQDIWPAVANSVTWGYGSSGTFGFRRPLFEDRWHNDPGHSFFLTRKFCDQFWIPFMSDGTIIEGENSPRSPHGFVEFISTFHIKYIACLLLSAVFAAILYIKYV